MSFQQYHDLTYDPYRFNSHPLEYQNSQDSLQALTPPSDEIFKTSPWSSSNLITNDMDCEEISQPERGIAGFVSKLYQCLQAPDDGHKYARWCKRNGVDMFIIDCIPKFTEIVLPKLFKHCKFASFVRQLNIYGFQRDTDARKSKDSRDKETCRWHHIHFRPGRRDLFHLIRRKTPRYSRRKRARTDEEEEEDPEALLNLGSGDESNKDSDDTDERDSMNSFINRRYSSSSLSSLPSTLQHLPQDNSYSHGDKMATYPQFHAAQYEESSLNHLTLYNQSNNAGTSSTLSHQQSPNSSLIDEQSYCQFQTSAVPSHDQGQNSVLLEHNVENHQLVLDNEDQLRQQITELRKGYTRMYKILTGEVNKANNIIDVQRARIEFLESSIRQQQDLKLASHPFIDTHNSNYFPTVSSQQPAEFVQIHTAPTTPVYPQSFNKPFMPYDDSMIPSPLQQQPYPIMYPKDELSHCIGSLELSSPCVSNHLTEKWMSPFQQVNE